jgi:hypothetical protein
MTANSSFDRELEGWLEAEAPARGPVGLHPAVIDRARTTRQRPGWLVTLRGGAIGTQAGAIGRPTVRLAYVLVILGLVLAALFAAFAAGAFRSDPAVLVVAPTPAAPTPAASTPTASAEALEDVYTSVLRSGVAFTSRTFEPHIAFKLATRSGLLDTIGLDPDW